MPIDDILEAQAAITARTKPTTDQSPITTVKSLWKRKDHKPESKPKKGTGGVAFPKPPHLDMELTLLFPIILLFAAVLAFCLGFYAGLYVKTREQVKAILDRDLSVNRVEKTEYKMSDAPVSSKMEPTVKKPRPTRSAVMHYRSPEEVRAQKEVEETDRELNKIINRDRNNPPPMTYAV